ncbi:MAG: hypothetical protein WCP85_12570 [Mariniphaga sp.]
MSSSRAGSMELGAWGKELEAFFGNWRMVTGKRTPEIENNYWQLGFEASCQ